MLTLAHSTRADRRDSSRKVVIVASRDLEPELGRTVIWRKDIERFVVPDADAGVEVIRDRAPNLVVVDANTVPAAAFVRRLREDPGTRSAAIAVVNRRPEHGDEESLRAAGANVVLGGPVDPVLWDARLAELLSVPPRREARIPVLLEAWAESSAAPAPLPGLALNISLHGVLLETTEPLEVGTKLGLSFSLPGCASELRAVAQVVRSAGSFEGRARSGIKFLVLLGDARERIEAFVATAQWPRFGWLTPRDPRALSPDRTERREWEAELRASEAWKTAILESALDCLVTVDHEGRIVELNRAAEKILGHARSEILGSRIDRIIAASEVERCHEVLGQCLASGKGQRIEISARCADGSERPFEGAITPMQLDGRRLLTAHLRDNTERKRAEDSLRGSARQFRALFEGAMDAMVIADDEGRYVEANAAACALYGLTRPALLGHWIGDFAEPGFDFQGAWCTLGETGRAKGDFRLVRADQEVRDVELAATADFLPGSHLVVLRDITERRQLEAQLRQSQKMEAVGRLAGGIAHDFNNLLAVISGYTELLLPSLSAEGPQRARAQGILSAVDRAAGLTRQLLAFSRRQVLQPKVFDLNAVVAEVAKMARRLIGEDVELLTHLDPQLGRLKADPGQIEQVLMNLLVNARDAMPQGGTVSVETGNVVLDAAYVREHLGARPGRFVVLRVSDTGFGMSPETQRHIFEPFFTTKEKGKGTGLGLATVYGIVKQSDGYIWVDSQPGHGTRFQIFLPRVDAQAETVSPVVTDTDLGGTETVLLVEDEEMLRSMAQEILVASGYHVLTASSGEEAMAVAGAHAGPIHLLLTDVVMPGMSGRQLARRLKPLRPETRVLYASGYTDDAIVQHGVLEPGAAFLQKPFTLAALSQKVREVLRSPRVPE